MINLVRGEALQALAGQGFPRGLAAECVSSAETFPIRLWVVDNSGSMQANDGKLLVPTPGGGSRRMSCSRWQELATTLGAWELALVLDACTDGSLAVAQRVLRARTPPCGGAAACEEGELVARKIVHHLKQHVRRRGRQLRLRVRVRGKGRRLVLGGRLVFVRAHTTSYV